MSPPNASNRRAGLPALFLILASTALFAGAALWPVPRQAIVVVFPPGVDAGGALARLLATSDGWRLRRIVATMPMVALVLDDVSDVSTLRQTIGAWLLFRAPPVGCFSPSP